MKALFSPSDLAAVNPGTPPPDQSAQQGPFTSAMLDMVNPENDVTVSMPPAPGILDRVEMGANDLPVGLGQIAENVAATPLNAVRSVLRSGLNAVGAPNAASLFDPVSSAQFDKIVQQREQDYQDARSAAGQTGIDWWRLAGQAVNPMNYAMPEGVAPVTVAGRIAQGAAQGAAVSAAQPVTTPGSFWWDKARGAALGGVMGAGTSGLIEAVSPALRTSISSIKKAFGGHSSIPVGTADAVVHDALQSKNVDPKNIDLNVLSGLKQEAQDAINHGAEPSPTAIANRALAESLPIPAPMTRGQLTGDGPLWTRERELAKIEAVGGPIRNVLMQQNGAFIGNLDALGAKDSPDLVSFGPMYAPKIQSYWDGLQAKKDALYSAVRNSQGQSSSMDGVAAADNIHAVLDSPEMSHAYDLLPSNIQRTIDDLKGGTIPFSVAQMQSLDKMWGMAARGADGSTAHAINIARDIINNAPIKDDMGDTARQAYFAARQAHAQQMSLIDPKLPNGTPNPNFQPLVKSVVMDGDAPENLFKKHFLYSAPSVAAKNMAFLKSIDPSAPEEVGRTLMGEIKRQALNDASEDRGAVSEPVLRHWANGPVQSARMDALLPAPAVNTFRNLAKVVESAKKQPLTASVNASNTTSAAINAAISVLKDNPISRIANRIPGLRGIIGGIDTLRKIPEVNASVTPSVTLKSMLSATPAQAARQRLLSTLLVPAAVSAEERSNGP